MTRLALIAGEGALPATLATALPPGWIARHLEGHAPDRLVSEPFRIERLGTLLAELRAEGVGEVCFAGRIVRPPLDPSAVDAATIPLVPRILAALRDGDDAALRAVVATFEEAGMRVRGAHELLPSLLDLPVAGTPDARDRADIARAAAIHAALAPLDTGQACAVAGGQMLAAEGIGGTDWMLASLATLPSRPPGGVLFKAAKPGQDRRIDMATVGPGTVDAAAAAGLSGIAVVAGDVLVLDAEAMRARLAATGLFLAAHTA